MARNLESIGFVALALATAFACSKTQDKSSAGASSAAASAPAIAAASPPAPSAQPQAPAAPGEVVIAAPDIVSPAEVLKGLDPCVIGNWKGVGVAMKIGTLSAEGGEGAKLSVAPTGAAVVDLTPMTMMHARTNDLAFDFRYSGTATATLKTPMRGTIKASDAQYSKLNFSVTIKMPTGEVPLITDRPLKELATEGLALAKAAPPSPGAAAPGAQALGVEENPAFSSSVYTCADSLLTLYGKENSVRWRFVKAEQ